MSVGRWVTYKCVYRFVGHVVSVLEVSDLGQVLSRKSPSSG